MFLLWDRFLSLWLPPEEVTGNLEADVDQGLRRTYDWTRHSPGGEVLTKQGTFAQKGGLSVIVVTEATTRVATRIPPLALRVAAGTRPDASQPNWLEWIDTTSPQNEKSGFQKALLNEAIRALVTEPRPHVVIRTGRRPLVLDEIGLGEGTVVVVSEPGRRTATDSIRVARARRALQVLGSAKRAQEARKLLARRAIAENDAIAGVDGEIRTLIGKLKVGPPVFFDALDLLAGVTPQELDLAGRAP